MIKKPLQYLVLSDIHLYHPNTTTLEIINHIDAFFGHYKPGSDFTRLDIIFIAGDLFDSLADFSNNDTHLVNLWLSCLIRFCSTYDIKLRVLEGTPSHDWRQSKIIEVIIQVMQLSIDYKYVDTLFIEVIEDINLSILYIPDEWTTSAEITQYQVTQLMKERSLQQVDIAMIHGMFGYQVEHIPNKKHCHSEAYYLSIVKYIISVGHIHTHTRYDRIVAQGSFDRLRHNEEEPKGAVLISLDPNGTCSAVFIENILAKRYVTITFKSLDIDKCSPKLDKLIRSLPKDSYVRIKAAKEHPFFVGLDQLKACYIDYNLSRIAFDKEDRTQRYLNTEVLPMDYQPMSITEANIDDLLWQQIDCKYQLTSKERDLLLNLLGEAHG